MGRRRRRVVRIVKKKLPTVFVCPRCGEEAVRVTVDKTSGKATVLCALCNLKNEFQAHPQAQPIDLYSYFTDVFYGVPNPRAIIPREREMSKMTEPEITDVEQSPDVENAQNNQKTTAGPEQRSDRDIETPSPVEEAETMTRIPGSEDIAQDNTNSGDEKQRQDEEAEPFADILDNPDRKRYSTRPLANQQRQQQQQEAQSQETTSTEQPASS
jgi:transcription elongation factor Elf1